VALITISIDIASSSYNGEGVRRPCRVSEKT
jgi:hypothetical protein